MGICCRYRCLRSAYSRPRISAIYIKVYLCLRAAGPGVRWAAARWREACRRTAAANIVVDYLLHRQLMRLHAATATERRTFSAYDALFIRLYTVRNCRHQLHQLLQLAT